MPMPVELLTAVLSGVGLVAALNNAAKVMITAIAVRGSRPEDRPAVIEALSKIFRWWPRSQ